MLTLQQRTELVSAHYQPTTSIEAASALYPQLEEREKVQVAAKKFCLETPGT